MRSTISCLTDALLDAIKFITDTLLHAIKYITDTLLDAIKSITDALLDAIKCDTECVGETRSLVYIVVSQLLLIESSDVSSGQTDGVN